MDPDGDELGTTDRHRYLLLIILLILRWCCHRDRSHCEISKRGDHLFRKLGNVGEFDSCRGNVRTYRIYSRISRPAYKPTPIPAAENVAKIRDPRISR